jgi:hypothetical protein
VDAYFCGHTHHNNATVWEFDDAGKILQINGCPSGKKFKQLIPIGESELILNPPPSKRGYAKGYRELHAYFVVSVKGKEVNVSLELIGGRKIWEFGWSAPGEIKEKLFVSDAPEKTIKKSYLKDIKEARLHIYPYMPDRILPKAKPVEITFNGKKIGALPRSAGSWHLSKPRNFIKVPPELVKFKNEIKIANPNKEHFAFRDSFLEIILNDGKTFRTAVYPYVIFAGPWENMYMDFGLCHPTAGVLHSSIEANVPKELIKSYGLNKPVSYSLEFDK